MDVRWRYLIAVGFAGWLLPAAVVGQETAPPPSADAPAADSVPPAPEPAASPSPEAPLTAVAAPEPTPSPTPEPPPPAPSPTPAPKPATEEPPAKSSDDANLIEKLGSFGDIEQLDIGDLLSMSSSEGALTHDDAPGVQLTVTEEDIRRSGARNLEEVLEQLPGFEVLTDNMGRGRIVVRGVSAGLTSGSSENVLILLNGLRLNEGIDGGATLINLDIAVDNIKKVEVVRGPGSVLNGPEAFQAVINIVTESVDTFRRDELTVGGGSFRTFLYNFRYGTTFGAVSIAGFMQFRYTGGTGLEIGSDTQTLNDQALAPLGIAAASEAPGEVKDNRKSVDGNVAVAYRNLLFNIRLKQETSGGFIGLLDALGQENQIINRQIIMDGEYHRVLPSGLFKARIGFSQSETTTLYDLLPQGYAIPASFTSLVSTQPIRLGGSFFQTELNTRRVGTEISYERSVGRRHTLTGGAGIDHEGTFGLLARSGLDLLTDVPLPDLNILPSVTDASRRIFDLTRAPLFAQNGENTLPSLPGLIPEMDRTVSSLYLQDAWRGPARVAVTGGLRLDHYTDFGSYLNPRLAVVYRAPHDVNLKLQYGRAVRTPTFLERAYTQPSFESGQDLQPATINNLDLGVVFRRKNLRLAGTVYMGYLRDVLMRAPISATVNTSPVINVPGIDERGFEAEATRVISGIRSVHLSYTYQHSSYSDSGLRVEGVPQHLAHLGANFDAGKYLIFAPGISFRGSRTRAPGDPRPDLDGYALVDLGIRAANFSPQLEFAATIQNLFDKEYFDPAPYGGLPGDYPRPGIGIYLKARYKF